MQKLQKKIIKQNVLSLIGGQSLSFIFNFFAILLAARYLGVENFGIFASNLSVVLILSKLIDFGLGPIIFREVSKEAHRFDWLNEALSLKIVISIVVLLLLNSIYFLIDYNVNEILLSDSLFITIFISSRTQNFREILSIPFKSSFKMQIPMVLNTIDSFLLLLGVLSIPYVSRSLSYFTIVYIVSSLPGFFLINLSLFRIYSFRYRFVIKNFLWLIKEALPLAGFVLMSVIFQQIDIILLKFWKSSFDAGVFAAATRLSIPLNIIPSTIVVVVFPIIVRNIKAKISNDFIIKIVLKILFIISISIAFYVSFNPKEFVTLVFGEDYFEAYIPTMLLCWSQVFLFLNFFLLDVFTAYNIQKWNFVYSVIVVFINIILDVVLISLYSYNGVGIAKLVASIAGFFIILKISKFNNIYVKFDSKRFIPYILISPIVLLLLSYLPILVYLILGGLLLVILILLLKLFNYEEIDFLLSITGKPKWLKKILKFQ